MARLLHRLLLASIAFAPMTAALSCGGGGGAKTTAGTGGGAGGGATSSSSTGSSGGAGGSDAGVCSLALVDGGACEACEAAHCCITASAFQAKPGSVWTKSAVLVCGQNSCATECGVTAATCGGITPDPASCLSALQAMCCSQLTACGASDQCLAVIYLCIDDLGNNPGTAGFNTCAGQYPEGLALFNPLNDCFNTVNCP